MIRRHIASVIQESLRSFPAVLLLGPRQVGKSTLAQQLVHDGVLTRYTSLDDLAVLEAAQSDPDGFVEHLDGQVALDEVQRVPDLMRALKRAIDADRRPGRFLLTGSANVLSRPGVTESLGGRVDVVQLDGLSLAELERRPSRVSLVEELLSDSDWSKAVDRVHNAGRTKLTRATVAEQVFFGGFSEVALKRETRFANRWCAAYVTTYVERDVRNLARLPDVVAFSRLFRLAGLRTGQNLNVKNLGADAAVDQRTAANYLGLLEITFQIERLPPWQASARKRLVKTPKVFLRDSGLACHLAGIDHPGALQGHPLLGALVETWVRAELRKHLALASGIQSSFYRTHQGKEVDFVLEKGRRCLGIEVKMTTGVTKADIAGLLDMQQAMGRDARGILLYLGAEVVAFSKRLIAAPLGSLL
jgi:predicted AAA+ superfamily ATPase